MCFVCSVLLVLWLCCMCCCLTVLRGVSRIIAESFVLLFCFVFIPGVAVCCGAPDLCCVVLINGVL